MTKYADLTPADFDRKRAPKSALAAADAGQDALFPGTPTLPVKPGKVQPEMDGQGAMFGEDEDEDAAPDWCCASAWEIAAYLAEHAPGMSDAEIGMLPRYLQAQAQAARTSGRRA